MTGLTFKVVKKIPQFRQRTEGYGELLNDLMKLKKGSKVELSNGYITKIKSRRIYSSVRQAAKRMSIEDKISLFLRGRRVFAQVK